jgi:hypothetical protein
MIYSATRPEDTQSRLAACVRAPCFLLAIVSELIGTLVGAGMARAIQEVGVTCCE